MQKENIQEDNSQEENIKDMINKNISNQSKKGVIIIKIIFTIIILLILSIFVNFIKNNFNSLNNNINSLNTTKDNILGNDNNNKGNSSSNFNVSINEKTYSFANFEEFKRKLEEINNEINNYEYSFIGVDTEKNIFNEKIKFKDIGYYINIPQLSEVVKSKIGNISNSSGSGIIIDLATYSYIDNKQLINKKDELIKKYVKTGGDILFSTSSGFTVSGDNFSFYVLKVVKEDIKKVNLSNPTSTIGYVYFNMEKTTINDDLKKLNTQYENIKKMNINLLIPTVDNRKNIDKFKDGFFGYRSNISNKGVNIVIDGKKLIEGLSYENGSLKYNDINFFGTGKVSISSSDTNIVVKNNSFFDLTNPNLTDNYPSADDFLRIINDNGGTVDLSNMNGKINEFVKFQIATGFEKREDNNMYQLVSDISLNKDRSPVVSINKIIGKAGNIKNQASSVSIISKKQLYSSFTPMIIKDLNNTVDKTYYSYDIMIGGKKYIIGDTLEILGNDCKISKVYNSGFGIECSQSETYNILGITGFTKSSNSKTLELYGLDDKGDKSLYIYDKEFSVSFKYVNTELSTDNLYKTLSEYIEIDKNIIQNIEYKKGSFYINFKDGYDWYVKSSPDFDIFLLFLIILK